jgi:hypothetical protein
VLVDVPLEVLPRRQAEPQGGIPVGHGLRKIRGVPDQIKRGAHAGGDDEAAEFDDILSGQLALTHGETPSARDTI